MSERKRVATVTVRAGELDLSTAAGRMVARMLVPLAGMNLSKVRAGKARAPAGSCDG